jgi:hypothetical protein
MLHSLFCPPLIAALNEVHVYLLIIDDSDGL